MGAEDYRKREELIHKLAKEYTSFCDGVIVTGSMAYAKESDIREDSDIDFLLISKSIRRSLKHFLDEKIVERLTRQRHFEAVCLSRVVDDVKISIHIIREESLRLISLTYVGDLRVFRIGGKDGVYQLHSFCGGTYSYEVKNIDLDDGIGFRTIVPISSVFDDRFFMGVYRDKLISNPRIIFDKIGLEEAIDQNWRKTVKIFLSEKERRAGEDVKFKNSLRNWGRFSDDSKEHIERQLDFYCTRLLERREQIFDFETY